MPGTAAFALLPNSMRVVYANARYEQHSAEGGPAHMRQFIENATALGHELFVWHGEQHPATRPVPSGAMRRVRFFRTIDVMYYRIEWKPPMGTRPILPPFRRMIGNPLVAWEFNTVPEYGRVQGVPEPLLQSMIAELKRLAAGVDVAFCVSNRIRDYVREQLGIRHAITVPNGSDPDLFRPDVPPVERVARRAGGLNVVWIGSANLAWHNFDLLRDAAQSIWDRGEGDQIVFHLIGPGLRGLRNAPPNMHYHGPEEYAQLPGWLTAMDVGVNVYHPGPADYSSPLKVFDYLASGLAVVSTEQPQAREIFERLGQPELLIPYNRADLLADALRRLASDPDYRRRQGAAGRQLIVDHYNWRRAARDIFTELERLARNRHVQPDEGALRRVHQDSAARAD